MYVLYVLYTTARENLFGLSLYSNSFLLHSEGCSEGYGWLLRRTRREAVGYSCSCVRFFRPTTRTVAHNNKYSTAIRNTYACSCGQTAGAPFWVRILLALLLLFRHCIVTYIPLAVSNFKVSPQKNISREI